MSGPAIRLGAELGRQMVPRVAIDRVSADLVAPAQRRDRNTARER